MRLREYYLQKLVPTLRKEFGYSNDMQVPRLEKIVVNMGIGEVTNSSKAIDGGVKDLTTVTGQKPIVTRARKSIASFKVREGMPIGACVTLRGQRMYDFLSKLISLALPRIRDFRGVSPKSFDGRGNFSLGVKEQLIFPEISYDQMDMVRGMDICIVTTARSDEEGRALLAGLGMPFRKQPTKE
jgi:large subunit ribosomal protein L5